MHAGFCQYQAFFDCLFELIEVIKHLPHWCTAQWKRGVQRFVLRFCFFRIIIDCWCIPSSSALQHSLCYTCAINFGACWVIILVFPRSTKLGRQDLEWCTWLSPYVYFGFQSHPKDFLTPEKSQGRLWPQRNLRAQNSREISGRAQSPARNGHPSIWWPRSTVLNFGFQSK